jgi:hypothetical protein
MAILEFLRVVATTYRLVCLMKAKVHSSVLISGFMLLSSSKSVTSPEKKISKEKYMVPTPPSISSVHKTKCLGNENFQIIQHSDTETGSLIRKGNIYKILELYVSIEVEIR